MGASAQACSQLSEHLPSANIDDADGLVEPDVGPLAVARDHVLALRQRGRGAHACLPLRAPGLTLLVQSSISKAASESTT